MKYRLKHDLRLSRRYARDYVLWLFKYRRCALRQKTFGLDGRSYPYFVHPYNHTWANERAVEIPVVRDWMARERPEETLEVGSVLPHYVRVRHTVLDKYERGLGARRIREDIVAYEPGRTFRLIVSVSTIEHVGRDEVPEDREKVLAVLPKLRGLLARGGRALVTVPVGYNKFLDECLRTGRIAATRIRCLRRASAENEWEETDAGSALQCAYGRPFPSANAVVFLMLEGE